MGGLSKYPVSRMIRGMKVKTSITLSRDVVEAIDARAGGGQNRSKFIEAAIRAFLHQIRREERNSRDLDILNRRAKRLNREAADVLGISARTADNYWAHARAWLFRELKAR